MYYTLQGKDHKEEFNLMQLKPPLIKFTKISLRYSLDSMDQHSQQCLQINFYSRHTGALKI